METADKQSFWLIEKVLFESAFIHSHLLAFFDFNIETGDYEIKSDCTGYEDIEKAFELINTAWAMWIRAKKNAVPEGFVLVPRGQIKGYYSHDGDNYQVHETLDQAKNDALAAIDHYSDQLADGNFHPESDGNFQDIGFGIVLGKSDYSLVRIVTQQDIDDGESKYPVGTEILDLYLNEAMIEAAKDSQ